jgi:hypothetical protein
MVSGLENKRMENRAAGRPASKESKPLGPTGILVVKI